jgi:SSS family solute:Na+ symporter
MGQFGFIDLTVVVVYFAAMSIMGWYFGRRAKTTEHYFVAGRSFPGWLVGVSLFGATISSITFVAYPADAFKTGYLRYVICITLPFAVLIASRFFVPFFRRGKITSVFEYLESRFGPRTRVYAASVFIISQCFRISLIQFLVALLVNRITGWDVSVCILVGGAVTAYYTVVGGIEAVIWTDFVQSVILTIGGLLILAVILYRLPGGLYQMLSVAWTDGKFLLNEKIADGTLKPIPWGFALSHKTVGMLLIVGLFQWLGEYSSNQENIQKYCSARSAKDARQAIWLSCLFCVPTWGYFMFLGTGLYVFYKVFPDPAAAAMLAGTRKAEEILPYFVTTQLPPGTGGIVVAAVLAAAMSSMSSAMNSISAVAVTDLYRRHMSTGRDDTHYVRVARGVTLASSLVMVGGAYILFKADTMTLQDLWTEFQSIIAGGLVGLYLLGFFTKRGDGRAVGIGIAFAVLFSLFISAAGLGWLPAGVTETLNAHFDSYYTGIAGNVVMFALGYVLALFLPRRNDNLKNLTVWTQDGLPLD